MKTFKKFTAFVLAMLMVLSVTGCSQYPTSLKKEWSYKTSDIEMSIGVYIYSLQTAYNQARSYAQKTEGYDSEKGTYDGEESFLKVEITDDDGNTAVAEEWIKTEADKIMKNLLAVNQEYNNSAATKDEAAFDTYRQMANNDWEIGEGINQYGQQYAQYLTPAKDTYGVYGVSEDSYYVSTYEAAYKQNFVFDALYAENGSQAVPESEIKSYFESNYTSYSYFSVPLYTTGTDEDGNSTTTPFEESEIKKYTDSIDNCVKKLNDGTAYADAIADYLTEFSVESDPTTSNIENLDNSSIGEDLVTEIKALEEGKAASKIIGEGDSKTLYLFYKKPIADETETYIETETNKSSLLNAMKGDEFDEYLDKIAEGLDIQINTSVIDKYKPSMFDKKNNNSKA